MKEYASRERVRVPMPPLPPPRPEIDSRMFNNMMMMRPSERVGVPVHERLAFGRIPVVEDRRRIRRRSKIVQADCVC